MRNSPLPKRARTLAGFPVIAPPGSKLKKDVEHSSNHKNDEEENAEGSHGRASEGYKHVCSIHPKDHEGVTLILSLADNGDVRIGTETAIVSCRI